MVRAKIPKGLIASPKAEFDPTKMLVAMSTSVAK